METREQQNGGMNVLEISGDVDLASSPDLRAVLHTFAKKRIPALVVDLRQVNYVDSSGLATLIEYVRLAQAYGGKFALTNVNERVRTILDLVRLTEFLSIYPSVDDARAGLLPSPGV